MKYRIEYSFNNLTSRCVAQAWSLDGKLVSLRSGDSFDSAHTRVMRDLAEDSKSDIPKPVVVEFVDGKYLGVTEG